MKSILRGRVAIWNLGRQEGITAAYSSIELSFDMCFSLRFCILKFWKINAKKTKN